MNDFNLALSIAGGVVLSLGLVAGYVKDRLWLAEPLICLMVGVLVGPALFAIMSPAELGWEPYPHLLEVARVTLGIAVMGAALRLPARYEVGNWRDLFVSLGIGLPLMWLTTAALAAIVLGLPVLPALLIGAVLCPTDPVVANSVTSGRLAKRVIPGPLRDVLTAESGANDGLALAFVMLPVLLLTEATGTAFAEWSARIILWEILGAVVIGAAIGDISGRLLLWAHRQPFSDTHSTVTVALALSITVVAAVRLIGSDGILAVFVAGLMLNRYVRSDEMRHEHLQEAIGRFFDLPVFVLLGAMLPIQAWLTLGWPALGFVAAVVLLRRLPWWLLLSPALRSVRNAPEAAFLGWFGPIGIASLYYGLLASHETGLDYIWPLASLAVVSSVVVHGITATPLTALFGRWRARSEEERAAGGATGPARPPAEPTGTASASRRGS